MVIIVLLLISHLVYRVALLVLTKLVGVYPSYPYDRGMVLITTFVVWLGVIPTGAMEPFNESSVSNPLIVLLSCWGASILLDRLDTFLSVSTDKAKIEVLTVSNNRR